MSARLQPWLSARFMRPDDLDAVIAIEQGSYDFPWSKGVFLDCLRMGYSAWVVTNRVGEVLGYTLMSLAVDEAHILNICSSPLHRREGVASFLLQHAIGVARQSGAKALFLEVRPSNAGAVALYYGFGFGRVGLRRSYYPAFHGREDALVLSLKL
jgi:ribosomal-protein-alanine N-acetyltransferase